MSTQKKDSYPFANEEKKKEEFKPMNLENIQTYLKEYSPSSSLNRTSWYNVWKEELEHIFDAAREKSSNSDSFLRLVMFYIDIKELNAEIIGISCAKIKPL